MITAVLMSTIHDRKRHTRHAPQLHKCMFMACARVHTYGNMHWMPSGEADENAVACYNT